MKLLKRLKNPNPYLQLHLKVYPSYLKDIADGTCDPAKDPFCSSSYILSNPFKNFREIENELNLLIEHQNSKEV